MKRTKEVKRKEVKGKKKMYVLILLLILLLLLLMGILLFNGSFDSNPNVDNPVNTTNDSNPTATEPPTKPDDFDLSIDANAGEIEDPAIEIEKAKKTVNDIVSKASLEIKGNSAPKMQDGTSEGDFRFTNKKTNRYLVIAELHEELKVTIDTTSLGITSIVGLDKTALQTLDNNIKNLIRTELNLPTTENITYNLGEVSFGKTCTLNVMHQLYRSKVIPIGSIIKSTKLDYKGLKKGEHKCRLYFYAIDPDTKEKVGVGGVNRIVLTVLN